MILYWYPKCSTCQKAYRFLKEKNLSFDTYDFVLSPLSKEKIHEYIEKSGLDISRFFNTSGMKYRELKLKEKLPNMSYEEKIHLLSSDGMLLKRPILVTKDKVLVGFRKKEWIHL